MFSNQSLIFGKVEKQINCEILKPRDPNSEGLASNGSSAYKSRSTHSEDEDDQDPDVEENDPTVQFWEDDYSDEEPDDENIVDTFESLSESEKGDSNNTELEKKSKTDSSSNKQKENSKAGKKKSASVKKPKKYHELNIPGSAKMLKVREKAKLADVFSRYDQKKHWFQEKHSP